MTLPRIWDEAGAIEDRAYPRHGTPEQKRAFTDAWCRWPGELASDAKKRAWHERFNPAPERKSLNWNCVRAAPAMPSQPAPVAPAPQPVASAPTNLVNRWADTDENSRESHPYVGLQDPDLYLLRAALAASRSALKAYVTEYVDQRVSEGHRHLELTVAKAVQCDLARALQATVATVEPDKRGKKRIVLRQDYSKRPSQ